MTNHITASVEFFFKGEKISAVIELDLDRHMQAAGKLPNLYPLLAHAAELDLYSYEYEIMQTEAIAFSKPTGLAEKHMKDDTFDIDTFEASWAEHSVLIRLQEIAEKHLSTDDMHQKPELKNALLEAYRLGRQTKHS